MRKLNVKTIYKIGDTTVLADVEAVLGNIQKVKRIQHYIYEEVRMEGILDLTNTVSSGVEKFVIPFSESGSYVDKMLSADSYHMHMRVFDLRKISYHGGTTLSSGVLPKWDLGNIFFKACSLSSSGRWQLDAAHEVYVMDLFRDTGVAIADAFPAYVLFYNQETMQKEVRFCEVARKFDGDITYYRDLRDSFKFGARNDQFIDFVDEFGGVRKAIINMLVVDYITNQEDRHAKNFGLTNIGVFTPLYDNGASLNYSTPDESLVHVNDEIAVFKALGKNTLRLGLTK